MMTSLQPRTNVWMGGRWTGDKVSWMDGTSPGTLLTKYAAAMKGKPAACTSMKTDGSGDWAWESCDELRTFFCERSLCRGDFSPSLGAPGLKFDGPVPLVDGVKIWYDRDYKLTDVPDVLVGASLFQGPHKSIPKGTEIKIHTDGPTTVYVFFEHEGNMRNGGYHINLGKRGFTPSGVDPA